MAIGDFLTFEGLQVDGYVCVGIPAPDDGYGWDIVYFDDPDPVRADWARRMWLRQWREWRLQETDWTENQSVNMKPKERQAWAKYRQQLRDLPACECSKSVECPTPPCFDDDVETDFIPWRVNNPPSRPKNWVNPRLFDKPEEVVDPTPIPHPFHDHLL